MRFQTGVTAGVMDPVRIAVIRGKAKDRNGTALPGVSITILDHPEFGGTLTRADGMFDLAVNGGGPLTVIYRKAGLLSVHRQLDMPWQDYVVAPDVVMMPYDNAATGIEPNSGTSPQVARGNPVADADGTRQATLLFPAGTTATMEFSDGSTQPLSHGSMRATEYTVGPNGPAAMPAALPPSSGYTYCVELTADEAVAANATAVRFNQPVPFYVENFLGFPVGGAVPVGYYDRVKGLWVPSANGRILSVLSVSNGQAELDVSGSGTPADEAALAELGITTAERQQLALLYQPGQSLWRVPITHFSPVDCNWPYGCPSDAVTPPQQAKTDERVKCPKKVTGSIIECQNQTLGEALDLAGTPFTLHYSSDRVPGRKTAETIQIPLSGATVPASLKRIELVTRILGREFTESFAAAPNQAVTLTWDGQDVYGRTTQGAQIATVKLGYVYAGVYQPPAQFEQSFAALSGGTGAIRNRAGGEVTLWQGSQVKLLKSWDARGQGLGAWTLNVHHSYDPIGHTLYQGDGQRRSAHSIASMIEAFAGTGQSGFSGDGGPAIDARMAVCISRVLHVVLPGPAMIVPGMCGASGWMELSMW